MTQSQKTLTSLFWQATCIYKSVEHIDVGIDKQRQVKYVFTDCLKLLNVDSLHIFKLIGIDDITVLIEQLTGFYLCILTKVFVFP